MGYCIASDILKLFDQRLWYWIHTLNFEKNVQLHKYKILPP